VSERFTEVMVEIMRPEIERIAREIVQALDRAAEPEPWMTSADAASYLGLSREAVEARARRGTLPGHKDGSRWLFRRDELDEALE
jgi:excisionase family DNA binding protein